MERAILLEQIAAWFNARSRERERERREREICCEERQLLNMWGVPTSVSEMINFFKFQL
jgi:hypothetical protein